MRKREEGGIQGALLVQLNPHLRFNGECEAAFKFYEKCH
jgi:hypothetical protein